MVSSACRKYMPKMGVTCSKGGSGLESVHTLGWAQQGSRGGRMPPKNGKGSWITLVGGR